MKEIKDTLGVIVDLGLPAADTGVKHAFFRFIEMALTDMIHHGITDKLIHNSFERWTQSEELMRKLAEEVFEHPDLTERVLEITESSETKANLDEPKNIVESWTQMDLPRRRPKIFPHHGVSTFVVSRGKQKSWELTDARSKK